MSKFQRQQILFQYAHALFQLLISYNRAIHIIRIAFIFQRFSFASRLCCFRIKRIVFPALVGNFSRSEIKNEILFFFCYRVRSFMFCLIAFQQTFGLSKTGTPERFSLINFTKIFYLLKQVQKLFTHAKS